MAINALGYCEDTFDPDDPGRLCRGRERWIEANPSETAALLQRAVISGAVFSDDSANDARRGLSFSTLGIGEVLAALFPNQTLHAWAEEGHPLRVPAAAGSVEPYVLRRLGGPLEQWACRWVMECSDAASIDAAAEAGADVFLPLPPDMPPVPLLGPVLAAEEIPPAADEPPRPAVDLPEGLRQRLYLLTGFRQGATPGRRFQAGALPDLLQHVPAVILLHQDKHAPCIGIYSLDPVEIQDILEDLCKERGVLPVPFAIPPMLARWDRALWELRQEWDEAEQGPFPVPPAPTENHGWSRRGRAEERA